MHSLTLVRVTIRATHLSKRTRCAWAMPLALSLLPSADAAKRRNQTKEAVQLGSYAGLLIYGIIKKPSIFNCRLLKDLVLSAREIYICWRIFLKPWVLWAMICAELRQMPPLRARSWFQIGKWRPPRRPCARLCRNCVNQKVMCWIQPSPLLLLAQSARFKAL